MIKKLTINDVDYIEQIFNLEKDIFKNSAFSKESTGNLVKADNSFIYVYLIDEKVCGYLMVLDSIDVYEILAIATVEEYRNKGIAQELLDKIKTKDIFLEVRKSNIPAISLYKKHGYIQEKFLKDEYGEGIHRYMMRKKL